MAFWIYHIVKINTTNVVKISSKYLEVVLNASIILAYAAPNKGTTILYWFRPHKKCWILLQMVKFKDFSRSLSIFQVFFKANFIFKDFSRQSCIFKYFSSVCVPCYEGKPWWYLIFIVARLRDCCSTTSWMNSSVSSATTRSWRCSLSFFSSFSCSAWASSITSLLTVL